MPKEFLYALENSDRDLATPIASVAKSFGSMISEMDYQTRDQGRPNNQKLHWDPRGDYPKGFNLCDRAARTRLPLSLT